MLRRIWTRFGACWGFAEKIWWISEGMYIFNVSEWMSYQIKVIFNLHQENSIFTSVYDLRHFFFSVNKTKDVISVQSYSF